MLLSPRTSAFKLKRRSLLKEGTLSHLLKSNNDESVVQAYLIMRL
jgi:hypothetical protein